ncbi:hypothetical protein ACO0J1_10100 [Stenotrophomonas acidaminiphila]|uniref:hypothetical protein n=1 Tax=Stenotrophomonas acidaminiphila TaxID=128780 RepID=UPI003BEF9EE9
MMLYQEAPHLRGFLLLLLKANLNLSLAIDGVVFFCRLEVVPLSIASLYIGKWRELQENHQSDARFRPEAALESIPTSGRFRLVAVISS